MTSLFTRQLKSDLGTNFKKCLEFREAKSSLLESYKDDFDFIELGKLAIDYSDGVVEAGTEVNPLLLEYAKEKKLPVLNYPGSENYADAYKTFYDEITGAE